MKWYFNAILPGNVQRIEQDSTCTKPAIYIYPITPYMYKTGSNDYILRVKEMLSEDFSIVNKVTKLGLLDIVLKLPKCDIVYFNWVADVADRRFGYLQVLLLFFILITCKIFRIKIAWFIHNDLSHSTTNLLAKKFIRKMMMVFSDVSFTHSNELSIANKVKNIHVYDHPVERMHDLPEEPVPVIDALIWGAVSPYKGVADFVRFNRTSQKMNDLKITIAGKFSSASLFEDVSANKKDNITIVNKVQDDEVLEELFQKSRYILFCYRSSSVLGSAALSKSLSFGKTVIGPNIGAFKELGRKGLIYTYDSFDDLADLLLELKIAGQYINKEKIRAYCSSNSWENFGQFLSRHLHGAKENIELAPATI